MKIGISIAACTLAFFLIVRPAKALDPSKFLSQYGHTAWRIEDGAFHGTPHALTQTTDGYIWIGTDAGLVKFDGVRFTPWAPGNGQRLSNPATYALLGASDGTLWIGTASNLASWKNDRLFEFTNASGRINAILEDHAGRIWAARSRPIGPAGGFCQVAAKELQCFGTSGGMALRFGQALAEDSTGNLWIGSSGELLRWKSGLWKFWYRKELAPYEDLAGIEAVAASGDDTLWVGFGSEGLGLKQLLHGVPKTLALSGVNASKLQVSTLLVDNANSLWIGTHNDGIYRVRGSQADHFQSEDGLSGNAIESFYEDREGEVWAVTTKGVDVFRDNRVASLSTREGLTADEVGSVLALRDGTVLIGNNGSLDFLDGNKVSALGRAKGLPGRLVTSLYEDHAGRLWIGVDRFLTVYERGRFQKINRPDGSPLGLVTALTEDRDHNMWAAVTSRQLFRVHDMRVREEFTTSQIPYASVLEADPGAGIWLGLDNGNLARYRSGRFEMYSLHQTSRVRGLFIDPDSSAWVATSNGIIRWKEGRWKTLTSKNGLPCDSILAAIRDDQRTLWAYARCGIMAIADSELERWWREPDSVIQVRFLDVFDGAQPAPVDFQPAVSKSPDGKLWFANEATLQVVDARHWKANTIRPPVHIEELIADRKSYSPHANVRLPPRTRDIEIDYTALSFVTPQKVRFRYKLVGRDIDWQEPGTRRQAFYSDLPPGSYRFQVIACNNDNLWNEAGAVLDFGVAPAYFQTLWFRLLGAALGVAALTLAYRLRMAQIERSRAAQRDFALRVIASQENERKRIAAELHDSLGQRLVIIKNLALLSLQSAGENNRVQQRIEEISSEASGAIGEVKDISYNLRPYQLDRMGLTKAIESLVRNVAAASGIDITSMLGNIDSVFPPDLRINFYRIVQEGLNNIVKHSHATKASVSVESTEDRLSLTIRDNGNGGAAANSGAHNGGFGLTGMVERGQSLGGKTSIDAVPGQGTTVHFEVIKRRET
ncbi:MAG TPA: two-component regulator propeller domain-containing protein [Bryobacteraceae bacterium]|jgi:signal transduction histidine kinase/ligand-binding sensor domain-containing protein